MNETDKYAMATAFLGMLGSGAVGGTSVADHYRYNLNGNGTTAIRNDYAYDVDTDDTGSSKRRYNYNNNTSTYIGWHDYWKKDVKEEQNADAEQIDYERANQQAMITKIRQLQQEARGAAARQVETPPTINQPPAPTPEPAEIKPIEDQLRPLRFTPLVAATTATTTNPQ
ncbi:MAG: hypothetical protein EBU46_00040 [Nitrosomonadaceae bacterium]|nr:hypothetical protein [Nitrosomonadaceae bacterium]